MPVIPAVIEFGEYRLDRTSRAIFRNLKPVKLTAKPFELLEFLITNHPRVVSKEELLQKVWGGLRDPNVIEQTIRQLRLVLEADLKAPQYIVTVMGAGYKFAGPLSFPEPEPMVTLELKNGLPGVSPVPGGDGAHRVSRNGNHAIPVEPELAANPSTKKFRNLEGKNRRAWARHSIVISLTFLGLCFFLYAIAPGEPAACEVSVNTLIVKDGQGREVWRREFQEHLNHLYYAAFPPLCKFVDLNHDGVADVIYSLKTATSELDGDTLYGLVTPSRFLRSLHVAPSLRLTFHPGVDLVVGPNSDPELNRKYDEYLPPYFVEEVFSKSLGNGNARIVVSSGMGESPNQITVLDGGFNKLGEYWSAGLLKYGQFATYHGHDRIFLGGVDNGYRSATVVAFDPDHVSGTTDLSLDLPDRMPIFAILATGERSHLSAPGPGTETCRVLFARTCVAKAKPKREPYNRVIDLRVNKDRIFVTVAESEKEDSRVRVVYEMDRHFNLVEAGPTTEFRQRHMELERAGLLDHAFSPEELKPLVRVLPGCEFVEREK